MIQNNVSNKTFIKYQMQASSSFCFVIIIAVNKFTKCKNIVAIPCFEQSFDYNISTKNHILNDRLGVSKCLLTNKLIIYQLVNQMIIMQEVIGQQNRILLTIHNEGLHKMNFSLLSL